MVQSIKAVRKRNAKAQLARSVRMKAQDYQRVTEWVHVGDVAALRDAANALRVRRAMGIPPGFILRGQPIDDNESVRGAPDLGRGNVPLTPVQASKRIATASVGKFQAVEPVEDLWK